MAVVETEEHGQVLVVRMNRPERLNALNTELRTALAETWTQFRRDDRFLQDDGGEGGDGEREVGADAALEEGFQRGVKHTGAAEDRRDERVAEAEDFAGPRVDLDALPL